MQMRGALAILEQEGPLPLGFVLMRWVACDTTHISCSMQIKFRCRQVPRRQDPPPIICTCGGLAGYKNVEILSAREHLAKSVESWGKGSFPVIMKEAPKTQPVRKVEKSCQEQRSKLESFSMTVYSVHPLTLEVHLQSLKTPEIINCREFRREMVFEWVEARFAFFELE